MIGMYTFVEYAQPKATYLSLQLFQHVLDEFTFVSVVVVADRVSVEGIPDIQLLIQFAHALLQEKSHGPKHIICSINETKVSLYI